MGLTVATLLAGTGVMTVTAAVSGRDVRKCRAITIFIDVHPVADSRTIFHRIGQDTNHRTGRDVYHIVDGAPPLREASVMTFIDALPGLRVLPRPCRPMVNEGLSSG